MSSLGRWSRGYLSILGPKWPLGLTALWLLIFLPKNIYFRKLINPSSDHLMHSFLKNKFSFQLYIPQLSFSGIKDSVFGNMRIKKTVPVSCSACERVLSISGGILFQMVKPSMIQRYKVSYFLLDKDNQQT